MAYTDIQILDCTIRDGGLSNDSHFPLDTVRSVFKAACRAGIDYVELGYRNSKEIFSPSRYGPWRFCEEGQLRSVVRGIDRGHTQIAIMQDAHRAVPQDILPCSDSVVDLIRIATYGRDIEKAIELANNAKAKGYQCTINIMAISTEKHEDLQGILQKIEKATDVDGVYIVDSYGSLHSEDVQALMGLYQRCLRKKMIGVHFHNSQQLAYANTLMGLQSGATLIDGTLYGLGRGAGNCPIELLVAYLKDHDYDIVPLLEVIQEKIMKMKEEIDWGYRIPYMLSGILNQHPRDAVSWMSRDRNHDFVEFYNWLRNKKTSI